MARKYHPTLLSGESLEEGAGQCARCQLRNEAVERELLRAQSLRLLHEPALNRRVRVELGRPCEPWSVLAAFQTTLDAGLEFERQAIRCAFNTADQQEGMNAFFEKRSPNYRGN